MPPFQAGDGWSAWRDSFPTSWTPLLLVQPDRIPVHFELGVVRVALHPRLRDHIEGRAGDRVPVDLVDQVFLELLRDGLALRRIELAGVSGVIVVDLGVRVS